MSISCAAPSWTDSVEQRQKQCRNKFIMIISVAVAVVSLILALTIIILYATPRNQQVSTPSPPYTHSTGSRGISLNSCINQSIEYIAPPNRCKIYPPNEGCTWSFDVYPMDCRIIPTSDHTTVSKLERENSLWLSTVLGLPQQVLDVKDME
ncbi:unnamed protein product [Adineta ricciae]|uniref:Uncharacterized protein n=1 Tax=Adineta ricciae TaxID=249248 RepID=A0A814WKX9_ADIRI|nr:unnamed protein product [Adineta ricciae]